MKADGYDGGLVGYDLLRYKIVDLAVSDYKRSYKAYLKRKLYKPYNQEGKIFTGEDLERFFRSDFFNLLAGDKVSGDEVISELRKQVEKEMKHGRSS